MPSSPSILGMWWWWRRRLSLTFLHLLLLSSSSSSSSSSLPLSSASSSPSFPSSSLHNFIRYGAASHVLRRSQSFQLPSDHSLTPPGSHAPSAAASAKLDPHSAPFPSKYAQKQQRPLRMFEVGVPVEDHRSEPCASVEILRHSFGNTLSPATATYRPPSPDSGGCASPRDWSRIVLKWRGASAGRQFDRIAGVWFGGVELLRTSTAEPSPRRAITWKVLKDVTKYAALLSEQLPVVVELGNVVDATFTGVFHINISLDFFPADPTAEVPPSYTAAAAAAAAAADLILPFSSPWPLPSGHWFIISNDSYTPSRSFRLPLNLHKAVIEIYVSFHGSDEFWYTNPPNDFLKSNDLANLPGNGAFREVQIFLDDALVGTIWPYPVIYTGGIVNLYWRPAVGIGAFDLPTYELDVSPFIGKLSDGKNHTIGVRVQNGLDHWLVDGSLHLWLDGGSSTRTGGELLSYAAPASDSTLSSNFVGLNGTFYTAAARTLSYAGYVATSAGNVSVESSYRLSFENAMVFEENTAVQKVKQKIVSVWEFSVGAPAGSVVVRLRQEYPLELTCITNTSAGNATTAATKWRCSLRHALNGNRWVETRRWSSSRNNTVIESSWSSYLRNSQQAEGEIVVVNNVLQSGLAELHQEYKSGNSSSSSSHGHGSCYTRIVRTRNSTLLSDSVSLACS